MKRDFSTDLIGLGDAKLVDEKGEALKLSAIAVNVLVGQYQDEQGLSGEDKFARYKLAERLNQGGVQEISAEEIALLKKLIGKAYGPIVVGPAYEALEADLAVDAPAAETV